MISLINSQVIYTKTEELFNLMINGKQVRAKAWNEQDFYCATADGDVEIINGLELLTEEERKEVLAFVNEER